MTLKFSTIGLLLLSLNLQATEKGDYSVYVVKPGDTVNTVLQDNGLSPLYGEGNFEEQTLKLNRLSKESTKKLEVGEVLILPLAQKEPPIVKLSLDTIRTKNSATISTEQLKERQRGNHTFTLWGEYFNRNSEFTEQGSSVQLNQNFALTLDYLYRDRFTSREVTFNPIASFGVYTQSNSSFSTDPSLTAELSPSFRARTGVEVEHRDTETVLTPFSEFEYFSYIDNNNSNEFSVRKDQILWAGAQLEKRFRIKNFSPFIGAELATSIGGSNERSVRLSNSLNGNRNRFFLGTNYNHHYNVEFYYESLELEDQVAFTVESTGFRLGYSF